MLIYPWFYTVYGRHRGLTMLQAVVSAPWSCNMFMVIVFLPQVYWFRLMINGAFKVLGERKALAARNGKAAAHHNGKAL
jgi:hypothetical protein